MDNNKLEEYRKTVKIADNINIEYGKNEALLVEIENRLGSSIELLGRNLEGDVALGILKSAKSIIIKRNRDLRERYEAL